VKTASGREELLGDLMTLPKSNLSGRHINDEIRESHPCPAGLFHLQADRYPDRNW
jgi:hypothetical protein